MTSAILRTPLAITCTCALALTTVPLAGAASRPTTKQLERAITVTSGTSKARQKGNVCPPSAGCASVAYLDGDPQPLTLTAGRRISIRLPYKASSVTLMLVRKNATRAGKNYKLHHRHGRWHLIAPTNLGRVQAVAISAYNGRTQINYAIGARPAPAR